MSEKEIKSLKARLARLEAEVEKDALKKEQLATAYGSLQVNLKESGMSLNAFVKAYYKEIKKAVVKVEAQNPGLEAVNAPTAPAKKSAKKRKAKKAKVSTVKIPAGIYGNLPSDPEQVFEVKEKGPRPKLLKLYAEEVGQEAFLEQCRIS
jgi:hypothetical protein